MFTKVKVIKDRGLQLSGGGKSAFIDTTILPGIKDAFIHEDFLIIEGDGDESLSIHSLDPSEIEDHIKSNVGAGFSFKGSNSSFLDDKSPSIVTDTSGIHNQFQDLQNKINETHTRMTQEQPINQPQQ